MSAVRDAATILLLRDRDPQSFEVFMVRRHGQSGFMAGAYVFPGGKLDEADKDVALHEHVPSFSAHEAPGFLGEDDLARETAMGLLMAAVRETFEEAGVLLADVAPGCDLNEARARLNAGASFGEVLRKLDARIRLDQLATLSRWITPEVEPRRFDTRFFVARAPQDQRAAHDARETTEQAWLTPQEAIGRMERGDIQLPPPTLKTLLTLSHLPSADAVIAHARGRRAPRVAPVIREVEGLLSVILPGDPLHPEREPALLGPTRLVLENGRFWAR